MQGTSRSVTKTKRWARSLASRLGRVFPGLVAGRIARMRSSLRSRSAWYCRSVVSFRSSRRRPMAMAREPEAFERGAERVVATLDHVLGVAQLRAKEASPEMSEADLPFLGMAALAGEHVGDPDAGPDRPEQFARYRLGPREGGIMCSTANAVTNTHSHWLRLRAKEASPALTRAEVSSEHTTRAAVTRSAIAAAFSRPSSSRASSLGSLPSSSS